MVTVYLGKKKMLSKLTSKYCQIYKYLVFSFCEVHKRNSNQLFYLFFVDRREGRPKVIKYFTESGLRNLQLTIFTPCHFQLNN